jgi:hypothetical protein
MKCVMDSVSSELCLVGTVTNVWVHEVWGNLLAQISDAELFKEDHAYTSESGISPIARPQTWWVHVRCIYIYIYGLLYVYCSYIYIYICNVYV